MKADDVRALNHVRDREKADAATAGFFDWHVGKQSPRVQLLTIEGLLSGRQRADHPDYEKDVNFKKAKREKRTVGPTLFGAEE